MKCKCGNDLFRIQIIPCCDDCSENGAWDSDEGEYTLDERIIDEKELVRNRVDDEGECSFDTAYGAGCHMYICSKCGCKENVPIMDGC